MAQQLTVSAENPILMPRTHIFFLKKSANEPHSYNPSAGETDIRIPGLSSQHTW